MPEEDIPEGDRVVAVVCQVKALTYTQKDLIVSLFDNLSIAHWHLSRAAANMSSLCKIMEPDQLILIMKCSVRPLVQSSASLGLFDAPIQKWKKGPARQQGREGERHYGTKGGCKGAATSTPLLTYMTIGSHNGICNQQNLQKGHYDVRTTMPIYCKTKTTEPMYNRQEIHEGI